MSSISARLVDGDVAIAFAGTLTTLLAVGSSLKEALSVTVNTYGRNRVCQAMDATPEAFIPALGLDQVVGRPQRIVKVLDHVARFSHPLAMEGLRAWGTHRTVAGNLSLVNRPWITEIPRGLSVRGHLDLSQCQNIQTLPMDMHVEGCLNLVRCHRLASLPDGLKVDGHLTLCGCEALASLGRGTTVGWELALDHCVMLKELPPDLLVCIHPDTCSLSLDEASGLAPLSDDAIRAMAPNVQGRIQRHKKSDTVQYR